MAQLSGELAPFDCLLTLARQQLEALRSDDVYAYLRLSRERNGLAATLPEVNHPDHRARARFLLEATAQIDAKSDELIRAGLDLARAEMGQIRQGHQAIRGYGPQIRSTRVGVLA